MKNCLRLAGHCLRFTATLNHVEAQLALRALPICTPTPAVYSIKIEYNISMILALMR